MYIFYVPDKEVVISSAFDQLRHLGIVKNDRISTSLFRVPLANLKNDGAQLNCGDIVSISSFVLDACSNIRQSIQTEGLFQKAGSSDCQKKIKTLLENGGHLEPHHHVIDVANLLKLFFRDLPEPLLPIAFHDVFIRCLLLKDGALQGVLLTCLLLPTIHLNTIAYFMEFLKEVTVHHVNNKMDARNLAIILTPSLMPVEEELAQQCGARLDQHVQIVQMLIEHAEKIGELPASISDKWSSAQGQDSLEECNNDRHTKKQKKRRSGSPTRMMVDKGLPEQEVNHHVPPTECSTSCVKSAEKRKAQELTGAFSSKKKYLHTKSPSDKLDSSIGSKSSKKQKLEVSGESTNDGYGSHRYSLERQWRGLLSKKKRDSTSHVCALSSPLPECSGDNADLLSSECVSLSKGTGTDINLSDDECKSIENKVICSPSARKIGTIRRSSRESAKPDNANSLNRNQTWNIPIRPGYPKLLKDTLGQVHGRRSIRQGCPNTILTGLPQLTPQTISQRKQETSSIYENISSNSTNLSQTQEIYTPHISGDYLSQENISEKAVEEMNKTPGNIGSTPQNVLCLSKASVERQAVSGRASVMKIRNQNAGMVLARTILLEGSLVSNTSGSSVSSSEK